MLTESDEKKVKEFYSFINDGNLRNIFEEAAKEASNASIKWLKENSQPRYEVYDAMIIGNSTNTSCIGYLLDLCGRAYLDVKDFRTSIGRKIKKEDDLLLCSGKSLVLMYLHHDRQEYGLHCEAVKAFAKVLFSHGILTNYFSYLD